MSTAKWKVIALKEGGEKACEGKVKKEKDTGD